MKVVDVELNGISVDIKEIYRAIGYADNLPDPQVETIVELTLAEISSLCRVRSGYRLIEVNAISQRHIVLDSKPLEMGGIITPFFQQAEYVAVFVATAGEQFESYLREVKVRKNIMEEFIVDAIGSEIAEAAARDMVARLELESLMLGFKTGNSYSPGYCGWNVKGQQTLFSLLPETPCGITLNDSCLMSPVKSISGAIPVGRNVQKMAYGCDICGKKDCYKKR